MRWFWQRREARQSQPFTDAVVEAFLANAQGEAADAGATSALETCAALYAAAFAAAKVEGSELVKRALTPVVRAQIARNLIRQGEDVHMIEVRSGRLMLLPVGQHHVWGAGIDEDTWIYHATRYGPSQSDTRLIPSAGVTHVRYATNPARPWLGVAPLKWAASTGALAGRLEALLSGEAGAPSAQVVPVPRDGGDGSEDDPLKQLKHDLAKANGKAMLVETTAGGWDAGSPAAPRRDWQQSRIGADWPDVLRKTRQDMEQAVCLACNVPVSLVNPRSEGTAQREGLRRLAHLGFEPLARIVELELAAKLETEIRINFEPLMASDLAGKARAIKGMVDAGLTLEKALEIAGVE